jgi:hypothetical protein
MVTEYIFHIFYISLFKKIIICGGTKMKKTKDLCLENESWKFNKRHTHYMEYKKVK